MDFARERYVKLYTRDTPTWLMWRWEARALFPLLLRKLDKAGRVEWAPNVPPHRAVAALVHLPLEIVESALLDLSDSGTIELELGALVMPNYRAGQEAKQAPATRKEESRARAAANNTVTRGHAESHEVTGGHAHTIPSDPIPGSIVSLTGDSPANSADAEPSGSSTTAVLTHPTAEAGTAGRTAARRRRQAAEVWAWHEAERTRRLCAVKTDPRGHESKDLNAIVRLVLHIGKRERCVEDEAWARLRVFREKCLVECEHEIRSAGPRVEKLREYARTSAAWSPKAYDFLAERRSAADAEADEMPDWALEGT